MVSAIEKAKRALVAIILLLARIYGCRIDVTRDAAEAEVARAYRTLSRRVHPDRGGSTGDQQKLNSAHGEWQEAKKNAAPRGRPSGGAPTKPKASSSKKSQPLQATASNTPPRQKFSDTVCSCAFDLPRFQRRGSVVQVFRA